MSEIRNNTIILVVLIGLYVSTLDVSYAAMLWPRFVLFAMLALVTLSLCRAIIIYYKSIRFASNTSKHSQPQAQHSARSALPGGWISIGAAFFYAWFIDYGGYFVATALMFPVVMVLQKERSMVMVFATTAIFLFIVWLVLTQFITLMLPAGYGLFRTVNNMIMF